MQSLALGLARFMALRADPLQEKLLTLWREWDEIFGPMPEDIVPLGHRESTLLLGAFSSIAMQEYRYVADQILEPVNRFLEEPVFNTIRLELVGTRTPLNRLDACRQAVSFSRPVPTAYMDSSPIVAITGQVPTHLIGNDAFQEADIIGITMPITKHSFQPKNPDLLPSIIKSSFEIAASGRPGPIIIDVPKEVQEGELTVFNDFLIQTPGYNPTIKGNIRQIRKAAELIKKAKRPLILAGSGVILANASVELKRFAEIINAPVMTSLLGKAL